MQSAYSLVHAASKAAGQSVLAQWFLQKLYGKVGATITGEANRSLNALNLDVTCSRCAELKEAIQGRLQPSLS